MPTRNHCKFCSLLRDDPVSDTVPLWDIPFHETSSFFCLPDAMPIFPYHFMIITKEHILSLADAGADIINEYYALAYFFASRLKSSGPYMEIEHGSRQHDKAGACVDHAHVHWLGPMTKDASILQPPLPRLDLGDHFDLIARSEPYVFIRANGKASFYNASGIESKYMRKFVARAFEVDPFGTGERTLANMSLAMHDWRINEQS
ncbi:MAG TPA: HIT domain-containing protein [Bacteroidetes bacterium]|nr:hypothetical protein BMS3Bbin04_00010 [bacterium BMS3Bbin04]HDO64912.1 HIT domain-containing protein [Bacteroidota bacterium]HEX04037.1 HIT domain-containing protein [Bacteroidota bacterium]